MVRTLLHGLAAAGAWILFVYWWAEVLTYTRQEDAWMVVLSLLLTVGLTAVITLVWVRHNIGIYRRKGPRRRLPEVPEESRQDVLGRPLRHPGSEALRRAAVVRVVPGEKEKVMERGEVS